MGQLSKGGRGWLQKGRWTEEQGRARLDGADGAADEQGREGLDAEF